MEKLSPEFKEAMVRLYGEAGKRRCAWVEFLAAQEFNSCITLQTNQQRMTFEKLRHLIREWLKHTDCAFIGRQHRKFPERRLRGTFHCEGLDAVTHAHGLLMLEPRFLKRNAISPIARVKMQFTWEKLIPKGTVKLDVNDNPIASAVYHTKEFIRKDFWETILEAEEFWPCDQRPAPSLRDGVNLLHC